MQRHLQEHGSVKIALVNVDMENVNQRAYSATPSKDLDDSDQVQPSQKQLDNASTSARIYWRSLAERAKMFYHQGLSGINIRSILIRVPAISVEPVCTLQINRSVVYEHLLDLGCKRRR